MNIPTCDVLCSVYDNTGAAVSGAKVEAVLSSFEIYEGYVVPRQVSGTTDEEGNVTLALWPNQLGAVESFYKVTITHPQGRRLKTTATVPNVETTYLHLIAELPAYEGKTDGQLMLDAVVEAGAVALSKADEAAEGAKQAADSASAAADSQAAAANSEAVALAKSNEALDSAIAAEAAQAASEVGAATAEAQAAAATAKAIEAESSASQAASILANSVQLTGDQTIGGKKTFESDLDVNGVTIGVGNGNYGTNTVVGNGALYRNTAGYENTAIGINALAYNTAGCQNTAIGNGALYRNTAGFENTAIGNGALISNTAYSNCSGFGYSTQVTGDNQVQLGNADTTTYVYGTVQNRSDLRDKADVRDTLLGLDFINALRPVDYRWDMREDYKPTRPASPPADATKEQKDAHKAAMDAWIESCKPENLVHDGSKKRLRYHHGLIAQEVKATIDALGIDFGGYQDHKVQGGNDVLSIGYDELIAPLIKAVQQLSTQNAALANRIADLGG